MMLKLVTARLRFQGSLRPTRHFRLRAVEVTPRVTSGRLAVARWSTSSATIEMRELKVSGDGVEPAEDTVRPKCLLHDELEDREV